MCFKCIYSIFVIILGIIVFFNEIYLEQYSMYFICFCLLMPIFISLLDKFEVIKIGSFVELSKKLDNIEKQQDVLFKQISVISNQTNIRIYANKDSTSTQEVHDNKQNDIETSLDNNDNIEDNTIVDKPLSANNLMESMYKYEQTILNYYLKDKNSNNVDLSPQALNYSIGDNIKRRVLYDAYFKEYNSECFVEIKTTSFGIRTLERIKQQIEAIKIYNAANKKNACLVLLLVDMKEYSEKSIENLLSRLRLKLQDYIQENLLYIEHYDYQKVQLIINNKE